MIDVSTEQLVSLSEAARMLPGRRCGKRPHVSCLYRWTIGGCRGVVLESIQVGATRCTSREALGRFFARLSGHTEPTPAATTRQRRREIAAAERILDEAGIGGAV